MTNGYDRIRTAVCTAFWLGNFPVAPGTVGTLPAVAVFLAIAFAAPAEYQSLLIGACFAGTSVLSILMGAWAERHWSRKDPKPFVLDEIASYFLTVLLFRGQDIWLTALWTFLATRLFDIIKPPPAHSVESLPAGWGILMDDLVASLYAAAVLHIVLRFFPSALGM